MPELDPTQLGDCNVVEKLCLHEISGSSSSGAFKYIFMIE